MIDEKIVLNKERDIKEDILEIDYYIKMIEDLDYYLAAFFDDKEETKTDL